MNRINAAFERLAREKKKAFIPYVTAGDPDMAMSKKIVEALSHSGADIIELGIPFSDPLADGPTIQKAIHRSLASGCKVHKVFGMVRELRKKVSVPLVFMTYYNIVFNYGVLRFIRDARSAGADGLIVPDLPMEESGDLIRAAREKDFCVVMLTAPTTYPERFIKIAELSNGFIYYVSLTGVTGTRKDLSGDIRGKIREIKKLTSKPVCVGFGVSTPAQAHDICEEADGVIVGSALIKIIEKNILNKKLMLSEISGFAESLAVSVHSK
ncbi:MAG: tryptophan synthase subunit alpha [Candidatus Omnitrophota bacterium]